MRVFISTFVETALFFFVLWLLYAFWGEPMFLRLQQLYPQIVNDCVLSAIGLMGVAILADLVNVLFPEYKMR
jgi:hypothetical protein